MPDMIRLSTADGIDVYEVPAGALCHWSAACVGPAVQLRRWLNDGAVPVCRADTEHAEWFRTPAALHEFEVPGVGHVTVAFGAEVEGWRVYRLLIGGVIVVEGTQFPAGTPVGDFSAAVAVCGAASFGITHAAESWRAPMRAWSAHYVDPAGS